MRLFSCPVGPFCSNPPCFGGFLARLCRYQQPRQIISGSCQGEHPSDAILSAMAGLAQAAAHNSGYVIKIAKLGGNLLALTIHHRATPSCGEAYRASPI